MMQVVVLRLPGLEHWMAEDGLDVAVERLVAFHERVAATTSSFQVEGELVWLWGDDVVDHALALLGDDVAGALGHGPTVLEPAILGGEASRLRRLVTLARVGEILTTPAGIEATVLPEGVGGFLGPKAIGDAVGHRVTVIRDYR